MILRSAQHPLDIMFEHEDSDNEDAAVQAFSVILDESYRWRSIDLYLCLPLLERLKVVRGKIPFLESLTMQTAIPSYSRQELPEEVRSVFIDAPCLRKVILHHAHGLGDFIFPHHITHLATCTSNGSNLEAYQSLVECRLIGEVPGPDVFPPHSVHLPNVRRLFVLSPHLLTYLRVPSLDDLIISRVGGYATDMDGVVLAMNEFVHRSQCTLTSLAVHNPVAFHQVFIEDCLSLMDSLVSLEIGLFWNADVEVILGPLASSNFLPNLQHLSLRVPNAQPSLWGPLTAMVSLRSRYLRSIRISCDTADDVERVNEHLAPLQLPGLSMVVSVNNVLSYFENFKSG